MKYFLKQYWRYVAMALAFATFNFFIHSCEVNAEEVYTITSRSWYYSNGNAIGNSSVQYFQDNIVSCQITECQTNGSLYWYATNNQSVINYPTGTTSILINMIIMNEGANEVYTNYSTASYINYVTANTQLYMINNDNSLSACQITGNSEYNISYKCPRSTNNTGYKGFRMNYNFKTLTSGSHWNIGLSQYYIYSKIDNSDLESIIRQQADRIITSDETTRTQIIATLNSVATQIINNNNTNTQSIISKFNEMLEQNQVCNIIDLNNKDRKGYLSSDGLIATASDRYVTNFIPITKNAKIKNTLSNNTNNQNNLCFYNINKNYISCMSATNYNNNENITIPTNASFVRFTIIESTNRPQFEICDTAQNITNQQNEQIIQGNNDINNSINNSNTEGGQTQANDFFNNFDSGETGSLMEIVSLPLDFLNSLNNTCSPISITLPFMNQSFELPCLRSSLTSAFGGIVSIIVLVINALLCYRLIKGFIDIVHNLKDPNNDDIEVMDL